MHSSYEPIGYRYNQNCFQKNGMSEGFRKIPDGQGIESSSRGLHTRLDSENACNQVFGFSIKKNPILNQATLTEGIKTIQGEEVEDAAKSYLDSICNYKDKLQSLNQTGYNGLSYLQQGPFPNLNDTSLNQQKSSMETHTFNHDMKMNFGGLEKNSHFIPNNPMTKNEHNEKVCSTSPAYPLRQPEINSFHGYGSSNSKFRTFNWIDNKLKNPIESLIRGPSNSASEIAAEQMFKDWNFDNGCNSSFDTSNPSHRMDFRSRRISNNSNSTVSSRGYSTPLTKSPITSPMKLLQGRELLRGRECHSSSTLTPESPQLSISPPARIRIYDPVQNTYGYECVFCKGNNEEEMVYKSHPIRLNDKVVCPILRRYICRICKATGDVAHTIKYCPKNERGFFAKRQNQLSRTVHCHTYQAVDDAHRPQNGSWGSWNSKSSLTFVNKIRSEAFDYLNAPVVRKLNFDSSINSPRANGNALEYSTKYPSHHHQPQYKTQKNMGWKI